MQAWSSSFHSDNKQGCMWSPRLFLLGLNLSWFTSLPPVTSHDPHHHAPKAWNTHTVTDFSLHNTHTPPPPPLSPQAHTCRLSSCEMCVPRLQQSERNMRGDFWPGRGAGASPHRDSLVRPRQLAPTAARFGSPLTTCTRERGGVGRTVSWIGGYGATRQNVASGRYPSTSWRLPYPSLSCMCCSVR